MDILPSDWNALAALVLLLGMKHGFDADHLAMIDGLTRFNSRERRPFARWCGALFSLGHGLVVIAVAVVVALASTSASLPAWLGAAAAWVSIFFLILLGALNLRAVLTAAPEVILTPVGVKGRLLGRLTRANRPWMVAGVGALFAVSFDTVSQATMFAVAAIHYGGPGHALLLGVLFMFGMMLTDGINGIWISALIARADEIARIASRIMSLAVAGVSLLVAGFSTIKLLAPTVAAWSEDRELWFGGGVCLIVLGGFFLGRWLSQARRVYIRGVR